MFSKVLLTMTVCPSPMKNENKLTEATSILLITELVNENESIEDPRLDSTKERGTETLER